MRELRSIGDEIPEAVKLYAEEKAESVKKFCSYLENDDGEVIQRVFAYRKLKGKVVEITECIRKHSAGGYITRNMYWVGFGGYQVIFKAKNKYLRSAGYPLLAFAEEDFNVWYSGEGWKPCDVDSFILNLDALAETKYKYCAFNGNGADLMAHLARYRDNPVATELFTKLGLRPSPKLMERASKDKQFRRFVFENADSIFLYGTNAAFYAYEHKVSVEEARRITVVEREKKVRVGRWIPEVKGTQIDRCKLEEYIDDNGINYGSYNDYLKAIKYLGLDLRDTKNVFPKDFARMHDLRIDEYASMQAKADKRARRQLDKDFHKAAAEAKPIAEYANGEYVVVIPQQICELIREGDLLHHCVGRMGYDKKMANGTSLIAFVRKASDIGRPLVTVEFDLKALAVKQAYGDHDSKPKEDVQTFVSLWEQKVKEAYLDLRTSSNRGA